MNATGDREVFHSPARPDTQAGSYCQSEARKRRKVRGLDNPVGAACLSPVASKQRRRRGLSRVVIAVDVVRLNDMTTEKTRKGYILAYALTNGIIEAEITGPSVNGIYSPSANQYATYLAPDIRWTREEAITELNKRIAAKRKSIEKQLAKLDKLAASPKFTTEAKVWPERKS